MYIFDSNIWIFALTEQGINPFEYYRQARDGDILVALDAYIYCEVLNGIDRSKAVEGRAIGETQERFMTFVEDCNSVRQPTRDELRGVTADEYLYTERNKRNNQIFADVFEIEPKDVPVVKFAHEFNEHWDTTILTNDKEFSKFDPEEHNLDNIQMEFVPVDPAKTPPAATQER